jgi:hypothetical protein
MHQALHPARTAQQLIRGLSGDASNGIPNSVLDAAPAPQPVLQVLVDAEQIFPDQIQNVHFQEKFEADRLSFDYCLRQGVVTTSNGLELMKSIGLDVS